MAYIRVSGAVHKLAKTAAVARDTSMQALTEEAIRSWLVPKPETSTAQPAESTDGNSASEPLSKIDTANFQTGPRIVGKGDSPVLKAALELQKTVSELTESGILSEAEIRELREWVGFAARAIRVRDAGWRVALDSARVFLQAAAKHADAERSKAGGDIRAGDAGGTTDTGRGRKRGH